MEFDLETWLQEIGIRDYDELTDIEKQTYHQMLEYSQKAQITLELLKENIRTMKDSIESSLATEKLNKMQDLFLKARLKNYLLLEAFFNRPEKARKLLDEYRSKPRVK